MRLLLPIFLLMGFTTHARIIHVGNSGGLPTLRAAVERAIEGDSILLHPGIYKEGNLVIQKSISIIGVNYPVLDGEGKHEILTISGKHIRIKGISFENAGFSNMYDYAAIKVIDADHVIIENNKITNAYFAVFFANASYGVVQHNHIVSKYTSEQLSGNGVHMWKCNNMVVKGNYIEKHRDGIYFEFVTGSIIQENTSIRNIRYGLHFMFSHDDIYAHNSFTENGAGVAVMFSKRVTMYKNLFDQNWGASAYGLLLKEISDSYILQNSFEKNSSAIHMEGTTRIEIVSNQFNNNGWALRVQASCTENNFKGNNFYSNSFDVATNGNTTLNLFEGNYWDKYEGYDRNRDGIGDIPFRPVTLYSMVIEHNPNAVILLRSFMVSLLDKAERAIPSLTPENLIDEQPLMKPLRP